MQLVYQRLLDDIRPDLHDLEVITQQFHFFVSNNQITRIIPCFKLQPV